MSLNSNDDFSLNYHLDTTIQDSTVVFDPSDPQILDQLNSNLHAAADSELFLRNSSDEEDSSDPSKEQPSKTDLMKKHSSIGKQTYCFLKSFFPVFENNYPVFLEIIFSCFSKTHFSCFSKNHFFLFLKIIILFLKIIFLFFKKSLFPVLAVTLAAGISEVWKHFFKSMDPKKERDAEWVAC